MTDRDGLREFVSARYTDLLRTAYLLTGSQHAAEDLVQTALVRAMRRWKEVHDPVSYVRRIMVNERLRVWHRIDPYERALERNRRGRRRQAVLGAAAGLALVVAAVPLVGAAVGAPDGGPGSAGAPGRSAAPAQTLQPAGAISRPMVRRLIDSPTRGNLAGDRALIDDLTHGYLSARQRLLVDPALTQVKVLLAHDTPDARAVVVVYFNDDHALFREAVAGPGASVAALLDRTGTPDEGQPLEPLLMVARLVPQEGGHALDFRLALGPAGCRPETSSDGRVRADGSVTRTWQPVDSDGYLVQGSGQPGQRWQFSCDGSVSYRGPAVDGAANTPTGTTPTATAPAVDTTGARGAVDPVVAATAARRLAGQLSQNGMLAGTSTVVWGGPVPGAGAGTPPAALVTTCYADGGCAALLQVGPEAVLPGRGPDGGRPTAAFPAVGRPDLVAARIPGDERGVLVVGPVTATRVELAGPDGRVLARGTLVAGVGRLDAVLDGSATVKAYDAAGHLVASAAVPAQFGSVLFGETITNWND